MPPAPRTKSITPKKLGWYIRKRDKTVVRIEHVGKRVVDYCTMPMLEVYSTPIDTFPKNFRLATAEEIAPHKDALP